MTMGPATTLALSIAFVLLALVNASLMAWLWRYPLDASGNSTAPKLWRGVHRGIGYCFALIYLAMLPTMLPRLWSYQTFTAGSLIHAAVGILLGPLLLFKVLVVRGVVRLGAKLPWIGGTLLVVTVLLVSIAGVPATMLRTGPPGPGKEVALSKCGQCHGASRIVANDESWAKVAEDMVEKARESRRTLSVEEASLAAAYLRSIFPLEDDEEERGRRRRGRGGQD